jgi:radical SAM superfamily enzyme YgiQ (UPF0313 family)
MKKVLVINPPNKPHTEKSLLIEPIDVLTIASQIKGFGNQVRVIDMDAKRMDPESIKEIVTEYAPSFTVIPFDYHVPLHRPEAIPGINRIAQLVKEAGSRTVIGGKTPKYYPNRFLENGFDVVINSEMEPVLEELLKSDSLDISNLGRVKGISFKDLERTVTTPNDREQLNVDTLLIPDRSLVDLSDYINIRSILSSRGCVSKCGFCATPDFWGKWRARSPNNVVDEIEYLVSDFDASKIMFLDDNATVNPERMKQIAKEIKRRGIVTTLGCLGMASSYNESMIAEMSNAGFRWIHYGGESGSQKVLDGVYKNITPEHVRKAIVGSKNAGLRVRTSWIYDLPGTDKQSVQQTNELILDTEPQEVRIHYLSPRVGTMFHLPTRTGEIPTQYIHHEKPQGVNPHNIDDIVTGVQQLTSELKNRGYVVIRESNDWQDVSQSRDSKFISFCPSRYGIGWER